MKNKLLLFGAITMIAGSQACKKVVDTSQLSAAFVVTSSRAKDVSFSSYATYFIADTIYKVGGKGSDTLIVGAVAQQIVGEIKKNMNARGYTFVNHPQVPDLMIRSIAIKQVNTGIVYPPGWWWGYPGYPGYCGYWGCYPPYYPVYPVAYSYSVGDFITEMFDVKNAETNNNLQVIWLTDSYGVLSSTDATNVNRTIDGINQAFVQSPYIQK